MSMIIRNNNFSMGANGFSTANRYPRQVVNPFDTVLTMVEGGSIAINAAASGTNGARITWRFECGALTASSGPNDPVALPSEGFAIDRPLGI